MQHRLDEIIIIIIIGQVTSYPEHVLIVGDTFKPVPYSRLILFAPVNPIKGQSACCYTVDHAPQSFVDHRLKMVVVYLLKRNLLTNFLFFVCITNETTYI